MHIFDDVGVAAADLWGGKKGWTGIESESLVWEEKAITITPLTFLKNTDAGKLIKVNMSSRVLG